MVGSWCTFRSSGYRYTYCRSGCCGNRCCGATELHSTSRPTYKPVDRTSTTYGPDITATDASNQHSGIVLTLVLSLIGFLLLLLLFGCWQYRRTEKNNRRRRMLFEQPPEPNPYHAGYDQSDPQPRTEQFDHFTQTPPARSAVVRETTPNPQARANENGSVRDRNNTPVRSTVPAQTNDPGVERRTIIMRCGPTSPASRLRLGDIVCIHSVRLRPENETTGVNRERQEVSPDPAETQQNTSGDQQRANNHTSGVTSPGDDTNNCSTSNEGLRSNYTDAAGQSGQPTNINETEWTATTSTGQGSRNGQPQTEPESIPVRFIVIPTGNSSTLGNIASRPSQDNIMNTQTQSTDERAADRSTPWPYVPMDTASEATSESASGIACPGLMAAWDKEARSHHRNQRGGQ